jgi:hypothetical protein
VMIGGMTAFTLRTHAVAFRDCICHNYHHDYRCID